MPEDKRVAAVVKGYVDSQALDSVEVEVNQERGDDHDNGSQTEEQSPPSESEHEKERRRRMAKLRRDSAKRTIEIIGRKFPELKNSG